MKTKIFKIFKREFFRTEIYEDDDIKTPIIKKPKKAKFEGGVLDYTAEDYERDKEKGNV